MTGREAVLRLKVKLNQLDTASNRTVRPEKVLLFLNDAYEKLAQAKYKRNHQQDETGFQFNQLATDDLNHLTRNFSITPTVENDTYVINISDIPNYWIHLKSSLKVKYGNVEKWVWDPNYCTLDTVNTTKNDPFNHTIPSKPVVYFEENKIKILVNGFSILEYKITYYHKPSEITLESVLNIPFIDEVIDTATTLMLENWGDQRFQTKTVLDTAIEQK